MATKNTIEFTEEEGFAVIDELMKSHGKDSYSGRIGDLAQVLNCKLTTTTFGLRLC